MDGKLPEIYWHVFWIFLVLISFHRAPYRLYPFSCHEANYSMPNILRGQRMADERARSAIAGD